MVITEIKAWPLLLGWTIVVLLTLFGWKRPAMMGAAGMLIITYAVLSAASGW